MNTPQLVEWQIIDEDNGIVMPWLTHPFLAWAKSQDWSDKNIIMFGAGLGDAWLAKRCKKLIAVERNLDWMNKARMYSDANNGMVQYEFRPCNDSDGAAEFYLDMKGFDVDIIINDDAYRTECCQMAIDYLSKKGGVLVCDNFNQDFVWRSPKAVEILEPYHRNAFFQPLHSNHEGNPWNTSYWNIPKSI